MKVLIQLSILQNPIQMSTVILNLILLSTLLLTQLADTLLHIRRDLLQVALVDTVVVLLIQTDIQAVDQTATLITPTQLAQVQTATDKLPTTTQLHKT